MNNIQSTLGAILAILTAVSVGCSSRSGTGENTDSDSPTVSRGEHDRDGDGRHNEEGEESGTEHALNETYNKVRNGARLILAYDVPSNSFKGTVENTTDKTLKRVRVEVHLSNGIELGPTTAADLNPGQKREVELKATNKGFEGWTAHAEVGSGEHDREGQSEHR